MEPKWVLTSGQKKIRFRNLLKKRKTEKKKSTPGNSSEDTEKMVPNETVRNQSPEGLSQKPAPKKSNRSFSDETQEAQSKVHTVPVSFMSGMPPLLPNKDAESKQLVILTFYD